MAAAAESVLVPEDVALRLMLPTWVLRIPQCWIALVPAWEMLPVLRQVLKWVMEPYLWQMDLCHQEEQCQKELIGSEDLGVFQQACKCK